MKPSKHKKSNRRAGGRTFGGGAHWKKKSFDRDDRREMFDATCSECGDSCQVPFKPNGRKPVKCTNCFKRDDGFGSKSYEPRDFGRGRSFKSDRRSAAPGMDTQKIEARLDAIEDKLDALIDALTEEVEEA